MSENTLDQTALQSRLRQIRSAPRQLLVGVLLMIGCGAAGAALLSGQSPSGVGWVAKHDIAAGRALRGLDFEVVALPAQLPAAELQSAEQLPDGAVAAGPIRQGELLYRSRVSQPLPRLAVFGVELPQGQVPLGLRVGAEVWLWQSDGEKSSLLASANVVELSTDSVSGRVRLNLEVAPGELAGALSASAAETLRVVLA